MTIFVARAVGEVVLWVREREEVVSISVSGMASVRGCRGWSAMGDSPRSSVQASARARLRMLTTAS